MLPEDIAADAADQEGAGAVEGGLRRLVAGLAAGREGHAMTDDAFALAGSRSAVATTSIWTLPTTQTPAGASVSIPQR